MDSKCTEPDVSRPGVGVEPVAISPTVRRESQISADSRETCYCFSDPPPTCRPWRSPCENLQLTHIPTCLCVFLFNTFLQTKVGFFPF